MTDEAMVRIAGRVPPDVIKWVRANYETESEAVREALTRLMFVNTCSADPSPFSHELGKLEQIEITQPVYPFAIAEHVTDLRLQLEQKDEQIRCLMVQMETFSNLICDQTKAMRLDYRPKHHWWQFWK